METSECTLNIHGEDIEIMPKHLEEKIEPAMARSILFDESRALVIQENGQWFVTRGRKEIRGIRREIKTHSQENQRAWKVTHRGHRTEVERVRTRSQKWCEVAQGEDSSKARDWKRIVKAAEIRQTEKPIQAIFIAAAQASRGWSRRLLNFTLARSKSRISDSETTDAIGTSTNTNQSTHDRVVYVDGTPRGSAQEQGRDSGDSNDNLTSEKDKGKKLTPGTESKKHDTKGRKWRLLQLNVGHHMTTKKWEKLAKMMEQNDLDGIALQELRILDDTSFRAGIEKYPGLHLILTPCIRTNTNAEGLAGGSGFLVRKSLMTDGTLSDPRHLSADGKYGNEAFATMVTINTGRQGKPITWISAYIRGTGNVIEADKVEKLSRLKGNLLIMGDLNGSEIYSREMHEWRTRGLGSTNPEQNAHFQRVGQLYQKKWEEMQVREITAMGKWTWTPTRISPSGVQNKLDMVLVTSGMMGTCKTKIVRIGEAGEGGEMISDHRSILMTMSTGRMYTPILYEHHEKYKLDNFLSNGDHQRRYREATDALAVGIKQRRKEGQGLELTARELAPGLKTCADACVTKEGRRRGKKQQVYRYANGERHAWKLLVEAKNKLKIEERRVKSAPGWRTEVEKKNVKRNKDKYYAIMRQERENKREKQQKKLLSMDPQQKARYISSLLKFATGKSTDDATIATDATMSFEGRIATATTPGEIRKLLAGYTYYVSMDSTDDAKNKKVDKLMEEAMTSFNSEDANKDAFHEVHRGKISSRVRRIEEEKAGEATHPNDKILNSEFTKDEFKTALKTLKKKMRKSPGMDGIHNWMIVMAGEDFKEMLLDLYNDCWRAEIIPEEWTKTLVSYIYKNKGARNELTSYRPIGLTSAIMNLFKRMWLARLMKVLAPQIAPNQGGFRKGSGAKEQLWMLVEFMSDQIDAKGDASFCTTDVHKAFDQVYREGTIYLLYAYGVRGTMLRMLTQWMKCNMIATPKWRGHTGEEVRLDANGLRQGCNLSPILYLIIINTLVATAPGHPMPEWDDGFVYEAFRHGVQEIAKSTDQVKWLVYLFVDDTAFATTQGDKMNEILAAYKEFIKRWRIRVNESKCKLLENEHMKGKANTYKMSGRDVPKVKDLTYLGADFDERGTKAQDKTIEAKSVQSRLTIRIVRKCLGEKLAMEFLESYTTPKVLAGAEFASLNNEAINRMHAWCISEAIGIGRHLTSEGYSGRDVNMTCIWADYAKPTWSQRRNMEAKRIHRSIMRMEETAIPKTLMMTRKHDNILTRRYTDTLYTQKCVQGRHPVTGAKTKEQRRFAIVEETLRRNDTEAQISRWKMKQKGKMKTERRLWRQHLQRSLTQKTQQRELLDLEDRTLKLGTGTAWIQSLAPSECAHSSTHLSAKTDTPRSVMRNIRRLKSGHMANLKTLRHLANPQWRRMDQATRYSLIRCKCGKGEVQDMQHIMTSCNWTKHIIEEARDSLIKIRNDSDFKEEGITSQMVPVWGKDLMKSLFHEKERHPAAEAAKHTILNNVHNQIARLLRKQRPLQVHNADAH